MGGSSSKEEAAADEVTAQFDPTELPLLRKAYGRLADPDTGALEASALRDLSPGVPWAALHAAMQAEAPTAPVRWRSFLSVVARVCKGRPSERREFVASALYAEPASAGTRLTKAALVQMETLLRPADGQEEGHELLEPTGAWLLSLALGPGTAGGSEGGSEWRCLYASRVMGLSLNRFAHHALGYAGPTLLVVLTEDNEVFGAYLDQPLKPSDKYAGGTSSVLFTLRPQLHVYRPTRISQNYVLYNPPQTGRLASESYFARGSEVPEGLGFGGQTARLRLSLEDDLNVLRWHHSCTTYAPHPQREHSVPEGARKVRALELWGCGGADADTVQRALQDRRGRDAARAGKVDRAAMFGLGGGGDWRDEDNVDRMILETAGAHTFYSSQLERLPDAKDPHGKGHEPLVN